MKSGCESKTDKETRSISLPVIAGTSEQKGSIRKSRTSRWRAAALITLNLLMIIHIIQWWVMGTTVSPIEPSEAMYTIQQGAVNAGFIFFALAILATLIFGRWVCGWGCHIVALQDFCAWLLTKLGLKPRPFRSRLLIYVPLITALYMFVWPTVYKYFVKPPSEPLFPNFTNHIITTEFWATFPPVAVAIPFLFIVGFVTVYFLGSKGFCTYGCPYGGVFVPADKIAPLRIRVTDACNQCGHCTATCMSNVQVHAEVKEYGMVIDPGCMKHMDCISVCPNDALYLGFGKPAVMQKKSGTKTHSLSWPEEATVAIAFVAGLFAVWNVYQLVPMLMAIGIAIITAFLAIRFFQLFANRDLSFYRYSLKSAGKVTMAGWIFAGFALAWIGLNAHSGWVRYHERAGTIAYEKLQIPDELALARSDPSEWLSPADKTNIDGGVHHLQYARSIGLFENVDALPKLAWTEYLAGNTESAVEILAFTAERQSGQSKALSLYYRGAILNRLKRNDEALVSLDAAIAERPDILAAYEERGESLWQLGRKEEAVTVWKDLVARMPNLPVANLFLSGAAASEGNTSDAGFYEAQAARVTPNDPYFQWMLGLRLQNLEMNELAEKHFQRAIRIDPAFRRRRT